MLLAEGLLLQWEAEAGGPGQAHLARPCPEGTENSQRRLQYPPGTDVPVELWEAADAWAPPLRVRTCGSGVGQAWADCGTWSDLPLHCARVAGVELQVFDSGFGVHHWAQTEASSMLGAAALTSLTEATAVSGAGGTVFLHPLEIRLGRVTSSGRWVGEVYWCR